MAQPGRFTVTVIAGLPLFAPGMAVGAQIASALAGSGERLEDGDVLVIAQKIVSKAEGRLADPQAVAPSGEARRLAAETGRDAGMIQLILDESS